MSREEQDIHPGSSNGSTKPHAKKSVPRVRNKKLRTTPGKPSVFNLGAWIPSLIRELADAVVKCCLIGEKKRAARLKNAEKTWALAQKIARESGHPIEEVLKHLNNQTSGVRGPAGELPPADR